jgi:hypothetical protein
VDFFLNKDITPFAFYANFNHYHFVQVLAKGITLNMSFSIEYPQNTTKHDKANKKQTQKRTNKNNFMFSKLFVLKRPKGHFA